MSLSTAERRYLDAIPDVDPARVGDVVGVGAQSLVRAYGRPDEPARVMKLPLYKVVPLLDLRRGLYAQTFGRILGQTYDTARRETDLCTDHFGAYVIGTEIVADARRSCFVILQDRLVEKEDATRERVTDDAGLDAQLEELCVMNAEMMAKSGAWLDMMGWKPGKFARFALTGEPYLENVAVSGDRLKLFDYGLFPVPSRAGVARPWHWMTLQAQRANMAAYGHEFGVAS